MKDRNVVNRYHFNARIEKMTFKVVISLSQFMGFERNKLPKLYCCNNYLLEILKSFGSFQIPTFELEISKSPVDESAFSNKGEENSGFGNREDMIVLSCSTCKTFSRTEFVSITILGEDSKTIKLSSDGSYSLMLLST